MKEKEQLTSEQSAEVLIKWQDGTITSFNAKYFALKTTGQVGCFSSEIGLHGNQVTELKNEIKQ